MFKGIRDWLNRRIVDRSPVSELQWQQAFSTLPLLDRLSAGDKLRLRELAILFLHQKSIDGAQGLEVSLAMKLLIALQACLPILNLGIDWYRGWVQVIVYPAGFMIERTEIDEYGLAHRVQRPLSGEAWQRGPVVLSWEATEEAGAIDGSNVVVHEFTHKLDMLNGAANGFPPLHGHMSTTEWTRIFTSAFEDFTKKVEAGRHNGINHYGATSPAEFIAVLSEVFFEQPGIIRHEYPAVYRELKGFFRQDPLQAIENKELRVSEHI